MNQEILTQKKNRRIRDLTLLFRGQGFAYFTKAVRELRKKHPDQIDNLNPDNPKSPVIFTEEIFETLKKQWKDRLLPPDDYWERSLEISKKCILTQKELRQILNEQTDLHPEWKKVRTPYSGIAPRNFYSPELRVLIEKWFGKDKNTHLINDEDEIDDEPKTTHSEHKNPPPFIPPPPSHPMDLWGIRK